MCCAVNRSSTSRRPWRPTRLRSLRAMGADVGFLVPNRFRNAPHVCCDDGSLGKQRFQHDEREALEPGWQNEDVERGQIRAHVIGPLLPDDSVLEVETAGKRPQLLPLAPVADQDERRVFDVTKRP